MARYRVELTPAAVRDLKRLDRGTQEQLGRAIDDLAGNLRPRGVKALQGDSSIFRLRSGAYRILYRFEDRALLVLVIRMGHRKDVYRVR